MGNGRILIPAVLLALLGGAVMGFFGRPILDDDDPITSGGTLPARERRTNTAPNESTRFEPGTTSGRRDDSRDHDDTNAENEARPRNVDSPRPIDLVGEAMAAANQEPANMLRPSGDGVISGKVTMSSTKMPVEGVLITVRAGYTASEPGPVKDPLPEMATMPSDADIRTNLQRQVARIRQNNAASWHVMTDTNGSYSVGGLAEDIEYVVTASHPRMMFTQDSPSYAMSGRQPFNDIYFDNRNNYGGTAYNVVTGTSADFTAIVRRMVVIDLVMPPGVEMPKSLSFSGATWPKGHESSTLEDIESTLRFQGQMSWHGPGDYVVLPEGIHAIRPNPDPLLGLVTAKTMRVDIVADGPDPRLTFTFTTSSGIEVDIKNEAGDFLSMTGSGYTVAVDLAKDAEPDARKLRNVPNKRTIYANTIRRGAAKSAFTGLESGRYWVALIHNNKLIDFTAVDVATDGVKVSLAVKEPPRSDYVLVSVVGPDGENINNARISSRLSYQGGSTSGSLVTPLPDGTFAVYHAERSGSDRPLVNPVYTVRVTATDYGVREVEYQLGAAPEAKVQFEIPAILTVTVVGAKGHPAEKQLTVSFVGGPTMRGTESFGSFDSFDPYYYESYARGNFGGGQSGSGGGGVYILGPIQPSTQTVELRIRSDSDRFSSTELVRQEIQLVGGPNAMTLTMPTLYSLTVHFPDGTENGSIRLSSTTSGTNALGGRQVSFQATRRLGADLRCEFEFLMPGDYVVSNSSGNVRVSEQVRIPGPGTVTLASPAPGSAPRPPGGRR